MSEDATRPSPQWREPQAPQGPPPAAWPPQAPPPQSPPPAWQPQAPQSPPPPAWQAQPQSPPPPAWQQQTQQSPPPPPWQAQQGPYGSGQGSPAATRRRRRRWPWITLIVIVLVLVVGDRVALAITENEIASQFQSSAGLSGKPHVVIQGFPFLTQLAARDFRTVDINATDETTGPLEIASLTATLHGMHIVNLSTTRIDQFNASALITFAGLADAGGVGTGQGITLSADGPNKIMVTVNIGPISDSGVAQVTQTGPNQVNIRIINAGGIPTSVLGNLVNFNITLPKLPAGVAIQSVSITQQGLMIVATGHDVTLSQNG
jgi:LmeA-like phospholipid-binding